MGCTGRFFSRFLCGLLMFLQVAAAGAVIGLLALEVANVQLTDGAVTTKCLMAPGSVHGYNICTYGYIVAAISLAATLVVTIVQSCTCGLCGLGVILDLAYAGAGVAWWAIAAVIFQNSAAKANKMGLPKGEYRSYLVYTAWAEVALFSLFLLAVLWRELQGCFDASSASSSSYSAAPRRMPRTSSSGKSADYYV